MFFMISPVHSGDKTNAHDVLGFSPLRQIVFIAQDANRRYRM
jgi:hypothetical protein